MNWNLFTWTIHISGFLQVIWESSKDILKPRCPWTPVKYPCFKNTYSFIHLFNYASCINKYLIVYWLYVWFILDNRELNKMSKSPVLIALAFQGNLDIEQDKSDMYFKENKA